MSRADTLLASLIDFRSHLSLFDASIKRGAVPIVLIDAQSIVDLMINKGFGVQIEEIAIPTYALDLALTGENDSLN